MRLILASLVIFLVGAPPAHALSATQLIRQGEARLRGKTTQTLMTMKIKRADFTRSLQLRSWAVGGEMALVEILQPTKEEGVVSLRADNQMWNYLPKTDQVVRVPTSLMLQSWMGSDFTNDDLMRASSLVRDYTHHFVKREKVGGEITVLVECRPKKGAPVVWGKIHYWARLSDGLPVQQKFFDENKKLVRTFNFSRFQKMDDRVVPTRVIVKRADSPGEFTLVSYQKLLYDRKLERGLFAKDSIRRTSQRGRDLASLWSGNTDADLAENHRPSLALRSLRRGSRRP